MAAACRESEVVVLEALGGFGSLWRCAGCCRHQLCGRLSRGSPAFSPGAEEGADLIKGRSLSFSSLPGEPELAAGVGMARQDRTVPRVSVLCCPCSFLKHSQPAPVMLRSQIHPWGSWHSAGKSDGGEPCRELVCILQTFYSVE